MAEQKRATGGLPMCGSMVCIAAVLLGVDVGWEPLPEGGVLYIIQIEPGLLDALNSGEAIHSDLPSYVRDVRAYEIVVGTGELPRELPPPEAALPPPASPPELMQTQIDSVTIDAEPAGYLEPSAAVPDEQPNGPSQQGSLQEKSESEGPARPWAALIVALLTLCGSLAANVYLGWITWDTRARYRALVEGSGSSETG